MHALAVFVHRQQTRGETYDLPEPYASPVALISPLYALPTLAQQYAAVPLLPGIPPLKKDATIFPPLAAVEVVAEDAGGGKNRAAAGAVERTCSVEEAHRLGAPLTEAGEEFLAAQAEEGQEEGEGEEEDDGDEGGHDEGGASREGEAEHEGDGRQNARRLRRLDLAASLLRENLVDGQLSYKSVVEGSSGLNQALLTWLLPLLRRRGVIVMEETRDDYIIRPGPRFLDVLESDGDESEEDEAEIAEQRQVVREQQQQEARLHARQRQRRPQEGQEGAGAKRRRAWGTSCSYCHAKKIKCGRHQKCLNKRVETEEGGSAAAGGGQEATGDDECEEEGATAAAAAGDEEGATAAGDENEEQREEEEAPPHAMQEGPRRPVVWGLRPDEGMAFAAVISRRAPPPPPPERLRRVGGKRMGPPKRKRIANAGSQPSQLFQSQASQG